MSTLPAGTWPSPITAASMVSGAVGISEAVPDGDDTWWAELRPNEGGRTALIRYSGGEAVEITPPGVNVRTRVHEYGGGAWWATEGVAYYVEFGDQRLRRIEPGGVAVLLTPEPAVPAGDRFADGRVTPDGRWFVCVRERHGVEGRSEAVNDVVAIATDGSFDVRVLATGADFYAAPRVSPDGRTLVWVQWMHPNMPWDSTELWVVELADGVSSGARRLVGNGDEALQEPQWTSDGTLLVVTDRTDWWNIYSVDLESGELTHVAGGANDVVSPHWVFGMSHYVDDVHVVSGGDLSNGVATPYSTISSLRRSGDRLVFVGASFASTAEVVEVVDGQLTVLRSATPLPYDDAYLPEPELISFSTTDDQTAHGLFYPPAHPDVTLPAGELPPLVVMIHGGPTASAPRQFSAAYGHRFWTSRGFAVVDLDYRGSSGYGRAFRNLLRENWCRVDVDDAVAAARFLAHRGDVDGDRLVIRGGSAGGTTTLLALARGDTFATGCNLFGVTDLVALMSDDHKFESQYSISLIGPWPAARERYAERSPINLVDDLATPIIVIQGADDTVVPPAHSHRIVDAVHDKGIPVSYIEFPGEGHGFRQAPNIIRAIEAELWFYGRILGFTPADDIEPVSMNGRSD